VGLRRVMIVWPAMVAGGKGRKYAYRSGTDREQLRRQRRLSRERKRSAFRWHRGDANDATGGSRSDSFARFHDCNRGSQRGGCSGIARGNGMTAHDHLVLTMADAVCDLSEGLSVADWHDCLDDLAIILAAHRSGEASR
jgi:hypothetical protein